MNIINKYQKEVKVILFMVFIAAVVWVSIVYTPQIIKVISNAGKFKDYITSFGSNGVIVYLIFNIAHVIIIVIPGELLQIAGGYIYGTFWGTVYTFSGMMLGIIIVFFITRWLGYSVIKIFLPKEKLDKFNFIINSPKSEVILFVLFLIPGIPKDALTYIAGLTPIKPLRFLLLTGVARFPGVFGSCYIGAKLESHNYLNVIVVSAVAVILFILGIIFQEKIVNHLHGMRKKK